MGSIRKTMASMLAVLALAAFMSDADAQTRRSSQSSQTRSSSQSSQTRSSSQSSQTRRAASGSQTRQSSNDNKKSTAARPSTPSRQPAAKPSSGADRKPSTTVTRPSSKPSPNTSVRPSADKQPSAQARPSNQNKPAVQTKPAPDKTSGNKNDFKTGDQNKPVQVTRPAPNRPQGNNKGNDRPGVRPDAGPGSGSGKPNDKPGNKPGNGPGMKPDKGPGHGPGKPVQIRPDHRHEPPRVHPRDRDFMRWDRPSYWWSRDNHYYGYRVRVLPSRARRHVYDGVTYYCYNDIWYRPYKGYYMVCRPPHGLSLAADIISQIAWAAVKISYYNAVADALSQINEPGLTQNYASRDTDYFYHDGVFYSKNAWGEYRVITPPAGALVESLPEDFDVVTLRDGNEYYKVDDTIYKLVISEGRPYFEVVGQIGR